MFSGKMSDKLMPVVKAEEAEEEELVDPQIQLRVCYNYEYEIQLFKCNLNSLTFFLCVLIS